MKKIPATKNNPKPEVSVKWRPTGGEPSPAWSRLWGKLLANKRGKPAGAGEPTADAQAEKSGNIKRETPPRRAPAGDVDEGAGDDSHP